jgi:hypothetical protein
MDPDALEQQAATLDTDDPEQAGVAGDLLNRARVARIQQQSDEAEAAAEERDELNDERYGSAEDELDEKDES